MTISKATELPLKLGFIGGSLSSAVGYAHGVASQLDNCWQLVSGCFSRDIELSQSTGKHWGIPLKRVYSDWQRFILAEKEQLDAVVVLTPTPSHDDIVCALLRAGIPVICEKAMAASIAQSLSIRKALEETSGFLAVTFNYSGYPMVRALKRHVEDGLLGQLKQIQVEMQSDGFIQPKEKMHPQPWRLSDGEIPTLLLDLAVHVQHLSRFVTGLAPVSVNADFHHFSIFDGIVDDAYMWVRCEEDMKAAFWVSKTALGHRNGLRIRVFGDLGSAEWYQEEPEKLHIYDKTSLHTIYDRGNCLYKEEMRERFKPGHPGGFVEAFANLYADIAFALKEYRQHGQYSSPYVFGWDHAHEGLVLLDAAVQSNEVGRWISLGEEVEAV